MRRRCDSAGLASDYISNVTEPIIASISGVGYTVPVTVRTVIYNHSADVKMSYTASPAVSVIWSLRIRRDNNLATDDTVFTYPEAYGSSYATSSYSFLEDAYSEGGTTSFRMTERSTSTTSTRSGCRPRARSSTFSDPCRAIA